MVKKCGICGSAAQFQIKNCSDFYCEYCACEQFGDIALLVKISSDAQKLKKYIDEAMVTEDTHGAH